MSVPIKTGWLNDKNGDKFAPKTLTSQIQTSDGILLENKIKTDLETAKTEILNSVEKITVDSELSSTSTNPVQNKVLDAKFNAISEAMNALETAVDGKANSSTTLAGYGITDVYTKTEVDTALNTKVDKIEGKGLSTNDYTTDEKNKLAGIAAGATANIGTITAVQANGVDIATSGVANIPIATTSTVGLMSAEDKTTLNAIPTTYATKAEVPMIEIVRW